MAHAPKALVILAPGAEEAETVCTVDVLRRGKVEVTVAGLLGAGPTVCSRQVKLVPDADLAQVVSAHQHFDAIVLPGGLGGTEKLRESAVVKDLLVAQAKAGKVVAAICAATTVLAAAGIPAEQVTSYPSFKAELEKTYAYDDTARVVVADNVITSRGPGTALEFGLAILEKLSGHEARAAVAAGLLLYPGQ